MDIREEAINQLLRIIEQVCRKLKISIYLPILLKKEKFKNIFKHNLEEFNNLYKLCNSTNWKFEDSVTEECSSKDVLDQQVSEVVQLHNKYTKIKLHFAVILMHLSKYEDEIITIMNDSLDETSSNYKNIVQHIEFFKGIVEWQMRMTPKQLREYKVKLRNARALITLAKEEIQKLESDFNDETLKHNNVVKEFQDEIINLNVVINDIKDKHNGELDREINSYTTRLRGLRDDTEEKENNLNNQLEAHEAMLEELIQIDLEQESIVREDCKNAESKYLAARNAYDRDLSKLNELKETLEMQLCAINNHYDILKNEYNVQSVLFINLKKERELAMMQAFAEQLDNFEKNRAARIIQRTWRAYHERISTKKKKRTRKNKLSTK